MKVFVTGATGLVGAHTALALLRKGHELRLLVRNKQAARHYFDKQGFNVTDYVEADMRQTDVVRNAMQECDAVLHSAAMVSLDPRKTTEIYNSNLQSITSVVASAAEIGIKNIVYVSSVGAFFDPKNQHVDEATPLAQPKEAYSRSKRDCEAKVRKLQSQGAPVQITYPSGIFGPEDPKLNESNHSILSLLKVVPITTSGIQFVDARDLATAHVKLLENPAVSNFEAARFMVAGHFYPWHDFHKLLEKVTGRKIPAPVISPALLRATGKLMDYAKRIYPFDLPITSESMSIVTQWRKIDSSRFTREYGYEFRGAEETLSDTIAWLHRAGHADRKYVGNVSRFIETKGQRA